MQPVQVLGFEVETLARQNQQAVIPIIMIGAVLGFIVASAFFSFLLHIDTVSATKSALGEFRTWWFALAFVSIGLDIVGRIVVVVYTYRGEDVRLISARLASPNERHQYEKGIRLQQRKTRAGDIPKGKDENHHLYRYRYTGVVQE